jgi:hypothetical protein
MFNAGRAGNLIEVESEEAYPSPAGLAQESVFQRQLAVKIRKKIDSKQYDEGSPVMIRVKEDTWGGTKRSSMMSMRASIE